MEYSEHIGGKVVGRVSVDGGKTWMYNLITRTFHQRMVNWLTGTAFIYPRAIALGFGSTAPSIGDTSLYNEYYRKRIASSWVRSNYYARFSTPLFPFEPPVPPGQEELVFNELGLFDAETIPIENHSFEVWSDNPEVPLAWNSVNGIVSKSTDAYHGTYSVEFAWTSGEGLFYHSVPGHTAYYGKTITFAMAVKTSEVNAVRLYIDGLGGRIFSDYHPGDNTWRQLRVEGSVPNGATALIIGVSVVNAVARLDWANCAEKGSCLARTILPFTKSNQKAISLIWEIFLEEEGTMYRAFDAEEIDQGTSDVGVLTPSKYQPTGETAAQQVIITVEDNPIRYWMHSGVPSSTSGHLLAVGEKLTVNTLENIKNLKFIAIGGTSKLKVTYFR